MEQVSGLKIPTKQMKKSTKETKKLSKLIAFYKFFGQERLFERPFLIINTF